MWANLDQPEIINWTKFIANAFRDGELKSTGTAFAKILPPVNMFSKDNARTKKKSIVITMLRAFFEKYLGIQ